MVNEFILLGGVALGGRLLGWLHDWIKGGGTKRWE